MNSRSGNAIVIILIAVFLFGALAAFFMRGARTGAGNLSANQARLAAQQILDYSISVDNGVQKLLRRGCSESDLSFENPYNSDHVNPSAPPDKSCHLFDPAGAGLTPMAAQSNWFPPNPTFDSFYYTSADAITDVGTTCTDSSCAELNINIWGITLPLCNELNRLAGNNFSSIPTDLLFGCSFDGNFVCDPGDPAHIVFADPLLKGKRAVCYNDANFGYTFNRVIIER